MIVIDQSAVPNILPLANTVYGFNESLTPHPYDLDLAKEYLKKAGYFAPNPGWG